MRELKWIYEQSFSYGYKLTRSLSLFLYYIYLFIYLFIYLSIYLFIYLIYLFNSLLRTYLYTANSVSAVLLCK